MRFTLIPRISFPDKKFVDKFYSPEEWEVTTKNTLSYFKYKCQGCGITINNPQTRSIHVVCHMENPTKESASLIPLCYPCHFTQHVDHFVEKKYGILVNSTHDQAQLIRRCRAGKSMILEDIDTNSIIPIKMSTDEYLEALRKGDPKVHKVKLLFGQGFDWSLFM